MPSASVDQARDTAAFDGDGESISIVHYHADGRPAEFRLSTKSVPSPFTAEALERQGAFAMAGTRKLTTAQQRQRIRQALFIWQKHPGSSFLRRVTVHHTDWSEVKYNHAMLDRGPVDAHRRLMRLSDAENFLRLGTTITDANQGRTGTPSDIILTDRNSAMIGYLYQGPKELIDLIPGAAVDLPDESTSRAAGQIVFGLWQPQGAFYLRYSAAYINNEARAKAFISAIGPLLQHIARDLEILSPTTARKYNAQAARVAGTELPFLCGTFSSVVINLNFRQRVFSKTHRDKSDVPTGYAFIIPFSRETWEGGDLVVWQAGVRFVLRHGDILVLNAANWVHSNAPVLAGERNSIVVFSSAACWIKTMPKTRDDRCWQSAEVFDAKYPGWAKEQEREARHLEKTQPTAKRKAEDAPVRASRRRPRARDLRCDRSAVDEVGH